MLVARAAETSGEMCRRGLLFWGVLVVKVRGWRWRWRRVFVRARVGTRERGRVGMVGRCPSRAGLLVGGV